MNALQLLKRMRATALGRLHDSLYVDEEGVTADFDSEWAEDYLKELGKKTDRQTSEDWLYVERSKYEASRGK